jgi:hypothetical protein
MPELRYYYQQDASNPSNNESASGDPELVGTQASWVEDNADVSNIDAVRQLMTYCEDLLGKRNAIYHKRLQQQWNDYRDIEEQWRDKDTNLRLSTSFTNSLR